MVGMAAVLAGSARAPLTALLLLFELTRDIRIVLPLMAAAGLSAALVERWQGLSDPGLLGPDEVEERRRRQLAAVPLAEALEPERPLVLPGDCPALEALDRLMESRGHCLLVSEGSSVVALVTLPDLQRLLSARDDGPTSCIQVGDCRRSELIWLPLAAHLVQLEDQLRPSGLRQLPVFDLPATGVPVLPHGVPGGGLPVSALCGLASRDGLARALARRISRSPD
jgi:hypothetical protein